MINRLFVLGGIIISAVCVVFLISTVELDKIAAAFRRTDAKSWSLMLVPYLMFLLLRAWRWKLLLGPSASYWSVFHAQNIGYLLTNVMPFRIGEIGRAFVVARQPGITMLQALCTVALERICDMVIIVLFFFISLSHVVKVPDVVRQASLTFSSVTLFLVLGSLSLVLWNRKASGQAFAKLLKIFPTRPRQRIAAHLASLFDGFKELRRWHEVAVFGSLSIAIWVVSVLSYYVTLRAFWPEVSVPAVLFTISVASFGMSVPSSPSAIGIFHASVCISLATFGLAEEAALAFAVIYHSVTYLVILVLGGIGLWGVGTSLKQIFRSSLALKTCSPRQANGTICAPR